MALSCAPPVDPEDTPAGGRRPGHPTRPPAGPRETKGSETREEVRKRWCRLSAEEIVSLDIAGPGAAARQLQRLVGLPAD
jgi:hypothetical protein